MSSTNRGAERRIDDSYMTPRWVARRLAEVLPVPDGAIAVEPCVGTGNIVAEFPTLKWITNDIREVSNPCVPVLLGHHCLDFLDPNPWHHRRDVAYVITNPPYSLAEEFIRRARELYPLATLVFLLRMAFMASAERKALWKSVGTPDLYVLPNRPSFTGKGTDSADYAWFVFPPTARPTGMVSVLASTSLEERKTERVPENHKGSIGYDPVTRDLVQG